MFILDSHCDTPSQVYRLRDLSIDNPRGHVDFPKMKKGGIDACFFALYIPYGYSESEAIEYSGKLLAKLEECVSMNSDVAAFAANRQEAMANKAKGLVSVFIGLENGSALGDDAGRLEWFYERGVRYMTLCHNADNRICDSAAQGTANNGLSRFGKEVVKKMNSLGMLVDCAHISDKSFYDVLDCSQSPVVSTHSCCRALSNHRRNMSDDMIKALADNGGVIQIAFYPVFLSLEFNKVLDNSEIWQKCDGIEQEFIADPSDIGKRQAWWNVLDGLQALPRPSYKLVNDHIDHVVNLVGIDHVGIGSDFDGISITPEGLENISKTGVVFEEMVRRGYSCTDIAKVAGENFLKLLG